MRMSHAQSITTEPGGVRKQESKLRAAAADHRVQFYESDAYLDAAVADFLADGLTVGQPLIVIATESRRLGLGDRLRAGGFDIDGASDAGRLTLLDARETLERFMVGRVPDRDRFTDSIGGLLRRAANAGSSGAVLRIYGEMVDVLWRDGNTDGAIHLEELWNELSTRHAFSLLCAYAMGNFYKSSDAQRFQEICRQHTHVTPTERYVAGDDPTRLREISILEQRALSLEAEVEHRTELERRLRETLAERRASEEALRRREQELSALLGERDRLLAAERAARAEAEVARTEAESATRAKSQFLAVMSHELRTPLNAIAGHVQLLEMRIHGEVSPAQHEALERIARSQRHLLRLVNDVLNLARVETGRIDYVIESVALQDLVRDLVPMFEPQLTARGLRHDVRLPTEPLLVRADREKLVQILLNLLSNAIKFTAPGGRIAIEAASPAADAESVCMCVSDTGVGIPREKHDVIFEPFVQVNVGPTRTTDGAGLGLAISRDLARGMRGELRVESVEGDGSTFLLALPRAD